MILSGSASEIDRNRNAGDSRPKIGDNGPVLRRYTAFDPSPRLPPTLGERAVLWIFGTTIAALFGAEVLSNFSTQRLSIPFVVLWWAPALVLHEFGHAYVARLLGWRVSEIVIGFGREIAIFRFGETVVRIKALPIEGYVVPTPTRLRGARFASAAIYAAGPGVELVFIALLRLLLGPELFEKSDDAWVVFWQSGALAAGIGAVFNLIPYGGDQGASDGLGIILSLVSSDESFRGRLAHPFARAAKARLHLEDAAGARQTVERGLELYPEDPQLRGLAAVCTALEGRVEEALDELESLGHPDDRPLQVRNELLASAAWCVTLGAQRELLLGAQQACERILETDPDSAIALLLIGRVLMTRGNAEQAYAQFTRGYSVVRERELEAQLMAELLLCAAETDRTEITSRFADRWHRAPLGPALRERIQRQVYQAR